MAGTRLSELPQQQLQWLSGGRGRLLQHALPPSHHHTQFVNALQGLF